MGQQQLILLVLATVIVGIAIIIGIRAFTENGIRANSDAMVQDMVRMASDAQAWKQKPAPFGGQPDNTPDLKTAKDDPDNYAGISFTQLGYPETAGIYTNLNGQYKLTGADGGLQIEALNLQKANYVLITVDGIADSDIVQTTLEVGTSTKTTFP